MVKKSLLVLVVFILFLLLIIPSDVDADSDGWRLWESMDCNQWSGGCEEGYIYVDGVSSVTLDSVHCSMAVAHVCYTGDLTYIGTYFGGYTLTPSNSYVCVDLRFSPWSTTHVSVSGEGYINGIVVDCYDPRPTATPVDYGTAPTPVPANLAAMGDAGEDILQESGATVLPLLIGLALGVAIVGMILRAVRWL